MSHLLAASVYYQNFEDEKIISHIFRISENCDQKGDRVIKSESSCHIFSMLQTCVLVKYENYGTMSINIAHISLP